MTVVIGSGMDLVNYGINCGLFIYNGVNMDLEMVDRGYTVHNNSGGIYLQLMEIYIIGKLQQ